VAFIKWSQLFVNAIINDALCSDGDEGSIDILVIGGDAPYTYDWDIDGLENPDNDFEDQTGLTAGQYGVEITDANGCMTVGKYEVGAPASQMVC